MNGIVDNSGRALLGVPFVTDQHPNGILIDCWIDTGFTGEILLPISTIEKLNLKKSGSIDATLADGLTTVLDTYSCQIKWFGKAKNLEVIANKGEIPLLGVGLLLAKILVVDYAHLTLTLDFSKK